jgi:hypothetical protein
MGEATAIGPIANLRTDRPWWRLQADDMASLSMRSGRSPIRWRRDLINWAGVPWDGRSALSIGGEAVAGDDVQHLLALLKRPLKQLCLPQVAVPSAGSVRVAVAGFAERESLAIDIDMGDFILPIAVAAEAFVAGAASLVPAVEGIIKHVEAAVGERGIVARREIALRTALEKTSARIGDGCEPLWLRMDPVSSNHQPGQTHSRHYTMVAMLLDDSLSWSPSPPEPIWTIGDVRDLLRLHGGTQRRRGALTNELRNSGSGGTMTQVSLALIRAADLEPSETLQAARAARIEDPHGALRFRRWGCLNILSWIEGVLRTSIELPQGRYDDGELTLYGDYPESWALACKRRPLTAVMDHPAFRAGGVEIVRASRTDDGLNLSHTNRVIPSEKISSSQPSHRR